MKYFLFCFISIALLSQTNAQKMYGGQSPVKGLPPQNQLSKQDLARMKKLEDTLTQLLNVVMYDTTVKVEDISADYTGAVIRNMALGSKADTTVYIK